MGYVKLALLVFLAGCQTTQTGFCAVAEPRRYSTETIKAMSDEEVKEALEFNLLGQKLCGWAP